MECQGYQTFTFLNRTYCSTFSSLAPVDYWVYAQAVHWQWLKVEGVKDIIFSIIKISHTSGAPSIKEQLPNACAHQDFFAPDVWSSLDINSQGLCSICIH